MNDRYVPTSNGEGTPIKQCNMVDDLHDIAGMLQEMRKRLCDIGDSTGCLGCVTNDIDDGAPNARGEIHYIKEN